jgi:hypothetical protein
MTHSLNINEELSFAASFGDPDPNAIADGFNEFGVRKNLDENGDLRSVDVNYEAMEPGDPENRNGVRITEEFLRTVASKDYSGSQPFMMDHERTTLAKGGDVRDVWFSEEAGKLMVQSRIPNTGSRTHDELIKRFTYEPPTVTNGSIGFGDSYEAIRNDDGEPELVDGTLREFSTTPFPGGYDDGGLRAAFAEEAVEAAEEFADGDNATLDSVYSRYQEVVNMTDEQLSEWDRHPCADVGSNNHQDVRTKSQMLLGSPKEAWDAEFVGYATEIIEFIERQRDNGPERPENGEQGTCPTRWAIQLLNRGYNPFDSMPEMGRPYQGDFAEVTTFEIDDKPQETSSSEDGFENLEVAVFTEQLSI